MIYSDSYYFIGDAGGTCYSSDGEYIRESNDWSSLIGNKVFKLPKDEPKVYIDKDVVPLITTWHKGVHAYVGILSIIKEYLKKGHEVKTLAIHRNVQDGILELVKALLPNNKILFLDEDTLYQFKSITLIPNNLHSYFEDVNLRDEISDMISERVPEDKSLSNINKLAILKHTKSGVASNMGSIDYSVAEELCLKLGYVRIEPGSIGELNTINSIRKAEKILFSWGSTFMKNFVYVSEKCTQIDVLIFGEEFVREYNAVLNGRLPHTYKNAKINYYLNPNLNTLSLP